MFRSTLALALLATSTLNAHASALMPDFANVPTGWTTDRYEPAGFSNVGTYQGRNDVLGISISSNDAYNNRPTAYQSSFYNTQGRQHSISGGTGAYLSSDLYIDASWSSGANGNVRTDMWGVMTNGTSVTDYPIIGFTNYGGTARFRVWDDDTPAGWVDLATSVAYDAWTSFKILFTGSSFDYFINGVSVYSDSTIAGSTGFSAVIMQAYNFGDPSIANANPVDYTVHWSNTLNVPEPGTLALVALGLAGLVAPRGSKQQ